MVREDFVKEIEHTLNNDSSINFILKEWTNNSVIISEFYFFKIFIDILKQYGFTVDIQKEPKATPTIVYNVCTLNIHNNQNILTKKFNENKLAKDLVEFNKCCGEDGNDGMRESAHKLVNMFMGLIQ